MSKNGTIKRYSKLTIYIKSITRFCQKGIERQNNDCCVKKTSERIYHDFPAEQNPRGMLSEMTEERKKMKEVGWVEEGK